VVQEKQEEIESEIRGKQERTKVDAQRVQRKDKSILKSTKGVLEHFEVIEETLGLLRRMGFTINGTPKIPTASKRYETEKGVRMLHVYPEVGFAYYVKFHEHDEIEGDLYVGTSERYCAEAQADIDVLRKENIVYE